LDSSDVIFVCVLPAQLEEVMSKLIFDPKRHTLISLVSTSNLPQLTFLSSLPLSNVFKMICLPSVATHDGTCLLVPKSHVVKKVLMPLGGCVDCDSEDIMTKMMIPACLMGPMYAIMKGNLDWMVKNGVPAEDASYYIGRTYLGIAKDAEAKCSDPNHFKDLIEEQTPGGINQQAIENLTKLGALDNYDTAMDKILERLKGGGDGKV
jgi:pyrroline-5-carboxylate reductase